MSLMNAVAMKLNLLSYYGLYGSACVRRVVPGKGKSLLKKKKICYEARKKDNILCPRSHSCSGVTRMTAGMHENAQECFCYGPFSFSTRVRRDSAADT